MLRSDVLTAATAGTTLLATHRATASAIEQRSVTEGEKATLCLSGKTTASTVTTSVAMHSPGPVIGGDGLKMASFASRS